MAIALIGIFTVTYCMAGTQTVPKSLTTSHDCQIMVWTWKSELVTGDLYKTVDYWKAGLPHQVFINN